MKKRGLRSSIKQALKQIKSTTDSVLELLRKAESFKANEDAQIYQHLYRSFDGILDRKTFPTLHSPQGHKKTIRVGEATLTITVTHRAIGIEDINGVDVVYDLNGWKTLAFQHKKRDADGRFHFGEREREQRDKIKRLCGRCPHSQSPAEIQEGYVIPSCGSVYVVGGSTGETKHVVSACGIERYREQFGATSSPEGFVLPQPLQLDDANRMFLTCIIGRVVADSENWTALKSIEDAFLTGPDLVFGAELRLEGPEPRKPSRRFSLEE